MADRLISCDDHMDLYNAFDRAGIHDRNARRPAALSCVWPTWTARASSGRCGTSHRRCAAS